MIEKLREKANMLPQKPGVYIMLDEQGGVLYVGKALRLKNRVGSYFKGTPANDKTMALVSQITDFDVIIADTEFEALVLENSLIKRHMPKYNILLKDGKGYPFVRVDTREEYPCFEIVNSTPRDGARYFGPYGGRAVTREAIEAISKALRLPTCNKKFPRDIGRGRPCLNYHLKTCDGYCRPEAEPGQYRAAAQRAIMLLEGRTKALLTELESSMEAAAEELSFELAASLRDMYRAVERLGTKQKMISAALVDTDVIGFYRDETKSCFVVLHYIDGALLDKDYELGDAPMETDTEAVSALTRQYYDARGGYPKHIILPLEPEDMDSLERMFSEASGGRVYLSVPQRGEKFDMVKLACENARQEIERVSSREERVTKSMQWLQNALSMDIPPRRIEAFDISNTGSSDMVASMTVHVAGKPLKKAYKRFKIKEGDAQDDYRAMAEVVRRRYGHYINGDEGFGEAPDLVLIDGGQAHANIARAELRALGLGFPVYGMVKDDRHRTRALMSPDGEEIGISGFPAVFALIGRIQEETHRFAIEYHRKLRSKNTTVSQLDVIEGVGPARKNALLKHFKSIKAIKAAGMEELAAVVPKNTAATVWQHFHPDTEDGREVNESYNGNGAGKKAKGAQ